MHVDLICDAGSSGTSKLLVMVLRVHLGLVIAAALCAAGTDQIAAAQSTNQSSPSPCSVIPQPDPCGSKPADKKAPADKFPFPGESSSPPDNSTPTLSGVPRSPDPPQAPQSPGVAPDRKFPFPGDPGAPNKSDDGAAPAPGTSSSSSSSADGEPSPGAPADGDGAPQLKDKGSEGQQTLPGRHLLHRVNPPGSKLQSPEEREAEDLDVARSYIDQENYTAAYMRSKDAVKIQPDDPAAHFLLAQVAIKLNKRDEAIEQYEQCLKLDPVDKEAKAARKALARLQAQR